MLVTNKEDALTTQRLVGVQAGELPYKRWPRSSTFAFIRPLRKQLHLALSKGKCDVHRASSIIALNARFRLDNPFLNFGVELRNILH